MIKKYLVIILVFSSSLLQGIDVSISCLTYHQPQTYIEIYSRVLSPSVLFQGATLEDSLVSSNVDMRIVLRNGDAIHLAERYNIQSPLGAVPKDFWDVKRFPVEPGVYTLQLQYVDLNNPQDTLSHIQEINAAYNSDEVICSDLLILNEISEDAGQKPFEKAGIGFEPLLYKTFGPDDERLYFHTEVYNIDQQAVTLYLKYHLENLKGEELTKPAYKKIATKEFVPFVEYMEIDKLPSGGFSLHIEVVNKEQEVLFNRVQSFAVYHPYIDYKLQFHGDADYESSFVQALNMEELNYSLKAIFPRVGKNHTPILNTIIEKNEIETKRFFLYNFWSQFSASESGKVYEQYMEVARAVDEKFSGNLGHGFEMDRGYIFLKYGKPDDLIHVEDEPSAPPYEIWIYNYLEETHQTGVKFLFYNKHLTPNDFRLLHSTCRGELQNPRWEVDLYSNDRFAQIGNSIDARTVNDGFNRNARRYFSDN